MLKRKLRSFQLALDLKSFSRVSTISFSGTRTKSAGTGSRRRVTTLRSREGVYREENARCLRVTSKCSEYLEQGNKAHRREATFVALADGSCAMGGKTANKRATPNRRPRFAFTMSPGFAYCFCTPPPLSAR